MPKIHFEPITKRPRTYARKSLLATCRRGHPYVGTDRRCRVCAKIADKRHRALLRTLPHAYNPDWATKQCPHGHFFTPANTYIRPTGLRVCRICHVQELKRYRQKAAMIKAKEVAGANPPTKGQQGAL